MPRYDVVVGNVGTVYEGTEQVVAEKTYKEYVEHSATGCGRAKGESVVLFENGEPTKEHAGYQHLYENFALDDLQDLLSGRREAVPGECPCCESRCSVATTPINKLLVEVVEFDDGADVRVHITVKCAACGLTFKDILRVVGLSLNEEICRE